MGATNLCLRYSPAKCGKFDISQCFFQFCYRYLEIWHLLYRTISYVNKLRRWQTFSLFALSELVFSLFSLSELVCTKNVFYPILLFPLLFHPKLLPLWSVTDRQTERRTDNILHPLLLELYHVGSSHFFGIGIYRYQIQRYRYFLVGLLYVNFGGNTFLSFHGNSFFEKFRGNSFFSSKGGWSVQRGGRGPPFLKRGFPTIFWGAPAKFLIPKILTEFSFGIGMVNTEKYLPIPTEKYRLGIQLYLLPRFFFFHWARGALPAGATLLGWPNYGVDGRLN
jgi:hypothetical protein